MPIPIYASQPDPTTANTAQPTEKRKKSSSSKRKKKKKSHRHRRGSGASSLNHDSPDHSPDRSEKREKRKSKHRSRKHTHHDHHSGEREPQIESSPRAIASVEDIASSGEIVPQHRSPQAMEFPSLHTRPQEASSFFSKGLDPLPLPMNDFHNPSRSLPPLSQENYAATNQETYSRPMQYDDGQTASNHVPPHTEIREEFVENHLIMMDDEEASDGENDTNRDESPVKTDTQKEINEEKSSTESLYSASYDTKPTLISSKNTTRRIGSRLIRMWFQEDLELFDEVNSHANDNPDCGRAEALSLFGASSQSSEAIVQLIYGVDCFDYILKYNLRDNHQNMRDAFEKELLKRGLFLETEYTNDISGQVFIKVITPFHALGTTAEDLKLRLPLKVH